MPGQFLDSVDCRWTRDLEMDGRNVALGFRFVGCESRTRYWEAAVRLEAPVSQADFGSEKQHRD